MRSEQFHPELARSIDLASATLIESATDTPAPERADNEFPSQFYQTSQITEKQIIGYPIVSLVDARGGVSECYFLRNGRQIGFDESAYRHLRQIASLARKSSWVRQQLSPSFVDNEIFLWWMLGLDENPRQESLSAYLLRRRDEVVVGYQALVPVAFLEVENAFSFGPVQIVPLTKHRLEELEVMCLAISGKDHQSVGSFFESLRTQIQGRAAVSIDMIGEPSFIEASAIEVAQDAIALLRFFSAPSFTPWLTCPCAVLGTEAFPTTFMVMYSEKNFKQVQRNIIANIRPWRLSDNDRAAFSKIEFDVLASLILDRDLTKFQGTIRSSLLTFSKGLTFSEMSDRLVYTFSALEAIFLRDSAEPIQTSVGERVAFIIATELDHRRAVVQNIKAAYAIRSKYIHHRTIVEDVDTLEEFFWNAREALRVVLLNTRTSLDRSEFLDAIDDLKYG